MSFSDLMRENGRKIDFLLSKVDLRNKCEPISIYRGKKAFSHCSLQQTQIEDYLDGRSY